MPKNVQDISNSTKTGMICFLYLFDEILLSFLYFENLKKKKSSAQRPSVSSE